MMMQVQMVRRCYRRRCDIHMMMRRWMEVRIRYRRRRRRGGSSAHTTNTIPAQPVGVRQIGRRYDLVIETASKTESLQ